MTELEKLTNKNVRTEIQNIHNIKDNSKVIENEDVLLSVTQSFYSIMFNEITESKKDVNISNKLSDIINSFAQVIYQLDHILNKQKLNLLLKQIFFVRLIGS